jgi:hypothetical protein
MISRFARISAVMALLVCGVALQSGAQTVGPTKRITQPVDEKNLVTLSGHVNPKAQSKYDQGMAPDALPMERIKLLLKRSPEQEQALQQVIAAQTTKGSPTFHQWLTPAQIGAQYGVSDDDVKTVSAWLESHGFQVSGVSPSKMTIEFSGTAGAVRGAFHTEIHQYAINGEQHVANATNPQIPAALADVVAGPMSLNNFKAKALVKKVGTFSKDKATGKVTPEFGIANCGPIGTCNALAPADFATIYNIPNWNVAGSSGENQKIAIVGDSEICTASSPDFSECTHDDIATFRTIFGLSTANLPTVVLAGPDPLFNGDETEGDLDVEWSGAVAPGAKILFVIGEGTEATAGIDLSAEYIVDNNLAPVLSESFTSCEGFLEEEGITSFYAALWEQAAAQGITVVVASGDSGSAGCDDADSETTAQNGLFVNGIASTPYNIAAGGTDFNSSVANYQSTFWNATNSTNPATLGASAKSYIPETTWNDSCAQTALSNCSTVAQNSPTVNIVGGGGGQSGFFGKPSWQTGVGVPNDSARDLPDISFFSADGANGSFYIVCESDLSPQGADCDLTGPIPFVDFQGIGGTSASAPTFAGVMALINQKMGSSQGNANYELYSLAATNPSVFHDITVGNNSVPCGGGVAVDCNNASASTIGELEIPISATQLSTNPAFATGTGYDLATGLGSINVGNLLAAWPASGSFTPTTTTLTLTPNPTIITHGGNVNISVTLTPAPPNNTGLNPEAVSLIGTCLVSNPNCFGSALSNTSGVDHFTSNDYSITNVDIEQLTNGSSHGPTMGLIGCNPATGQTTCSYNVTAHYPGNGTLGASDSAPVLVTVNPENTVVAVEAVNINPFNGTPTIATSEPYGSINAVRVDVGGLTSQQETATGTVTITDSTAGCPAAICATLQLNPEGYAEAQTPNISIPGSLNPAGISVIPVLPLGAHHFSASYSGDGSYKAQASSSVANITITQATTATSITQAPTSIGSGVSFSMSAFVDTTSLGNSPTGTLTFFNGTTQLGMPVTVTSTLDSGGFSAATATITGVTLTSAVPPASGPTNIPLRWLPVTAFIAAVGCVLLLMAAPRRQRRTIVIMGVLLFAVAIAAQGCGGHSGGTTTPPPPANGSITVKYSGDTNYIGSTSTAVTITVN